MHSRDHHAVLQLVGICLAILLAATAAIAATGPHHGPEPTVTTDTGTSAGPCQEGHQR